MYILISTLHINDIISLEATCLTFAIICRHPLACSHIQIECHNIYKKLVDFVDSKLQLPENTQRRISIPDLYRFKRIKHWHITVPTTLAGILIFKAFAELLANSDLETLHITVAYDNECLHISSKTHYESFKRLLRQLKSISVLNLNIWNHHKNKACDALQLIIEKAAEVDSLTLQNMRIHHLDHFLRVTKLSMVYCNINHSEIGWLSQCDKPFRNLKIFKYQQRNDLIHHYDAYFMAQVLARSIHTLRSLFMNINLFSYGNGILSALSLPQLHELAITLTPKLRPDDVDWDHMTYFRADNLRNLCLIFSPCHLFDVNGFVGIFASSVQNIVIVSKVFAHDDVVRLVRQIVEMIDQLDCLQSLAIKVEAYCPMNRNNRCIVQLESMLSKMNNLDCALFRLETLESNKSHRGMRLDTSSMNLKNEWIFKEWHSRRCNTRCVLELSKNKEMYRNIPWIQFENLNVFDDPLYFK
eukprot:372277_1